MGVLHLICMVTLLVSNVYAYTNMGMITYLSDEGLNEMLSLILNAGVRDFNTILSVPDINGEYNLHVGVVNWRFYEIQITALAAPNARVSVDRENSMLVIFKDFTFQIRGRYKIEMWPLSDSGSFEGTLCTNLRMRGTLGDNNILKFSDCGMDVTCGIGLNFKDNNFDVPDIVQNEINSKAKSMISSKLASKICEEPFSIDYNIHHNTYPINDIFAIDVSIRKLQPVSTKNGVTIGSAGSVYERFDGSTLLERNIPFLAPEFKNIKFYTHKMMEMVVNNYTVNTFMYTAVRLGYLNRQLQSVLLPPNQKIYFSVDCRKICFGHFFPMLTKRYPGGFVNVNITFTNDIKSRVSEQGIYIYNTLILDFYIRNDSLVKLRMNTETVVVPYIANDTIVIRGILKEFKIRNIQVISSSLGPLPSDRLHWMTQLVKDVYLVPRVKGILLSGIDVSNFSLHCTRVGHDVYLYHDVDISLRHDTIRLSGNVAYRPGGTD